MSVMTQQAEVHTLPTGQATTKQIIYHYTWSANPIASYACELIKQAVMVAPPQNPDVLVDRCIAIAELAFDKFEEKGWLLQLPSWDELNEPTPKAGFLNHD